ncbi:FAD-dependent oxidoreductase [Nocardia sp. AG03]|uniref:flavin monoamine oxidase family protein n=1 Tax=Nocardia sp. AG03 TaxID=3025312 RepID=UPI002418342A|nr:FAD-dependent oxidoreductase [Nocardia sp. AG03]
MTQQNPNPQVVVVGAGMSGLVAARALRREGVDVVVLEAAPRPGGRVLAETTVLGSRVDLGGQWIGHGHHRFAALAAELGTTVYPMRTPTLPSIVEGDTTVAPVGPTALTATAVLAAWEIASRVGVPRSWRDRTVDEWLARVPGRRARRLLAVVTAVATTADIDRVSMRALLDMVRFQGGLRGMLTTSGGAQDSLVVEGAGTLAERLAAELGARVVLDSPVTALRRDASGVTVESASGTYRAAKVIVTVPPPTAARIEHHPPLPAARISLQDNTCMGSVYKAIAVYDRPFWRERAEAETMSLTEPGSAFFDTSSPDGPGHLCVLVAGAEARALDDLTAEARRARILGAIAGRLGPEIRTPRGWHEKSWHRDAHAGGGYTVLPKPGYTDGHFPFPAAPSDNLHWAGAETASEHAGYIEGAIESGERVAREVVAALAPAESAGR